MSEPDAFLILFGERRERRCLVMDRATADLRVASLHGIKVPLVVPEEFRHLLDEPPKAERHAEQTRNASAG